MGLCQCEIQKGCVRDVCNDWHMDGIQKITLNKKFSGISYWCGVMYEIPIKQHEDNCGSFPLPLYFLADLCTGFWKDCISVPPGRQGTGEVGNGARLICSSGVSGALAHLLSYSCVCVLNCLRKGLYDWLLSLSTGCHPEHAVWQLLRISAWTMAVGALSLESYTNCCSSEALKAPCEWFTEKGCLVILPSAKGKLRKQRKMRNVSKYNSPLCSAMFFFLLLCGNEDVFCSCLSIYSQTSV